MHRIAHIRGLHMRAAPLAVTALAAALLLTGCSSDSCGSGSGDSAAASPSNGTTCRIGAMDVEVGAANVAPAAGDTGNIPVTLTNESDERTLHGFPGNDPNATAWSASVSHAERTKPTKLTL